jgi:glycine cleavage system H lipoate-binding protein
VYVRLPEVGTYVILGKEFSATKSMKATTDINLLVSGEAIRVKEEFMRNKHW